MKQQPHELDVRPILRGGGEPFQAIMHAVAGLKPGQGLRLLATFRPEPLFRVMEGRGFTSEAREIDGGDWEVLFAPKAAAEPPVDVSTNAEMPQLWPDPDTSLDLTDLDPPEPMVRILAATEQMEPGRVLFALLSREPLFLFPELTRRHHQWVGSFDDAGEAYRILIRIGTKTENDNG